MGNGIIGTMVIKIIFANILGGKEFLGTKYGETNFGDEILDKYIDIFAKYQPDIVSLAEVHLENENGSKMVEEIAKKLQLSNYDIQGTDKSHVTEGKILGNAILSHFPISKTDHFIIQSPRIEVDRPNGDHWIMHDKGAQSVTLDINDRGVTVGNLQYFPFHHFNRAMNEPDFASQRQSLVDYLSSANATFVTGDFNNKNFSLIEAFPELFQAGFSEAVETETTIVGDTQQLDHILFNSSQARVVKSEIVTIPSDHFGLFVEFELL